MVNLYLIKFTNHLTKLLKKVQGCSDRYSMNIKTVKAFNQSMAQMNVNFDEMKKAIKANTAEFKKITERIEKAEEVADSEWDKLDPYTEDSKRPLAKGSAPAVDVEVPEILLKKLDIL